MPEDTQLWKGFNGHGLYAKRAEKDRNGEDIVTTYAKQSEVPVLTNELNTSETTAVTPGAVKEAIDAIVKIPDTANQPSTLYVGGQGMGWTGWVTEEIDVPDSTEITIGEHKYPIVKIGNQYWLGENLDYKADGIVFNDPETSGWAPGAAAWYYDKDETTYGYNGRKYGLLYNAAARDVLINNAATLLPAGWHIPSLAEWNTLASNTGGLNACGSNLKSTQYWSTPGIDRYGFNAVPAGYRRSGTNPCSGSGYITWFWSSDDGYYEGGYQPMSKSLSYSSNAMQEDYWHRGYCYGSIRLVKTVS